MSDERRAIERHLCASSTLLEDVCLLGPLDACCAVIVPRPAALTAQQVLLPGARLRELLLAATPTAPHPVRIDTVALLGEPLPRGTDGEPARDAVAALVAARPAPDLPATPATARLLARLEAVLEVPGPYAPGQRLEADLGVDSLTFMQLRALLEREFDVRLPDDEVWRVQTVGDVLRRVAEVEAPIAEPGGYTWPVRLREPVAVPLEQRFNLDRRGLHHASAQCGMWFVTLLSKVLFRTELVHRERLPTSGPFLLCPTHSSLLDSPLIYATFPYAMTHRTVFIAFGPYFRSAPMSWLVRMGRLILTGEGSTATDSVRLAFDGLRRGLVVCIFPEGSCSYSGQVLRPKPGVGILACEAQAPIVPIVFQGSGGTCSPRQPGLRFPKIRVLVGEPIPPPPAKDVYTRADYQAVADRWREAVVRLQREHAP